MKSEDSLLLARQQVRKALTGLRGVETVLSEALDDIDKAKAVYKKERKKLFTRKQKK